MAHTVIWLVIAIEVIFIIVAIIYLIENQRRVSECEGQQSPFCPQVICPDGTVAYRIDDNGQRQLST